MNLLETALAFLEGMALIASPCILPVLPLVLSASVDGGRKRPFGIIIGFVLAFSLFALASRQLVSAFHLDLDYIKNSSLILLFALGMIMFSRRLSERFTQWTQGAANFGSKLSASGGDGLFSGIVIGSLIGLVWTPCAGPILAAVLVQVIRQKTDLDGILMIIAFAIGAGIPMLCIALMGKKMMNNLHFFKTHSENIRRGFGLVIMLTVGILASGVDAQSLFTRGSNTAQPNAVLKLEKPLDTPYQAPEIAGIEHWINSQTLTMSALKGKVVLIDFWTYSCINCVRTLPYVTAWDEKYRDNGLVILGIHAPEFEFEKDLSNVRQAVAKHHIRYPVALDNNLSTWENFKNRYWPAHYLIDREGRVVYTHFGEGEYEVTENNIRYLLGLKGKEVVENKSDGSGWRGGETPETYLGYRRMASFDSKEPLIQDKAQQYRLPAFLPVNHWALEGKWNIQAEKIVSTGTHDLLQLNFNARKVFLVLGSASGKPVTAKLKLNGAILSHAAGKDTVQGRVTIDRHTLYELIDQGESRNSLLEIEADGAGLEAYAFTFGS